MRPIRVELVTLVWSVLYALGCGAPGGARSAAGEPSMADTDHPRDARFVAVDARMTGTPPPADSGENGTAGARDADHLDTATSSPVIAPARDASVEVVNRADSGTPAADGAPSLPRGSLALPFRDGFQMSDVNDWTPVSGNWAICPHMDQKAYCQTGAAPLTVAMAGNPAWTDYQVTATLVVVEGSATGLASAFVAFRATTPDTFWAFHIENDGSWELCRHRPGSGRGQHTNGGGFVYQKGVPFTIRATIKGQELRLEHMSQVQQPGIRPIVRTDFPASGRIGIGTRGESVKFLSVSVTPI